MDYDYSEQSSSGQTKAVRGLRRLRVVIAVAAVLAALVPAAPAMADTTFTITGGGFGHGVGMSQFGAYGMAREGYTWDQILTHYFTDVEVTEVDPSFVAEPIWVNLQTERDRIELTVSPTWLGEPVAARFTIGDTGLDVAPGETAVIESTGWETCSVTAPVGVINGRCILDIEWDGWEETPTTSLVIGGCYLSNWNHPSGTTVAQPCTYARGTIHVRPDNNSTALNISVEIDIEDYVLGISEMPYVWGAWGGQDALMAQAVAARSYALSRAIQRGDAEDRPWCACHIYDTTVDQSYVGWGHGRSYWIDAVRDTAGMVITRPDITWGGVPMPLEAFYSSSTFGWTEDSEDAFVAEVSFLRSVDDHWAQLPDVGNHHARWELSYTGAELASRLPGMSTVTGVEVTACSATGAALEVTFHGDGGPRSFATKDLRGRLSLRSMQIISFTSDGSTAPACAGHVTGDPFSVVEGGPVTLTSVAVDDDAAGDSLGNGNGVIEGGELIEVFTEITNDGADLTGVTAVIRSNDPYVSVSWNTDSGFGHIAAGATAANQNDWDLLISDATPQGHVATVTLVVDADNGGPWEIPVVFELSAAPQPEPQPEPEPEPEPTPAPSPPATPLLVTSAGDVDRDGEPDSLVVTRVEGKRPMATTISGATGAELMSATLPNGTPVDAQSATLEGRTVAVILIQAGTRVVAVGIDVTTGERVAGMQFGRGATALDLEVHSDGATLTTVGTVETHGRIRSIARTQDGQVVGSTGFRRGTTLIDTSLASDLDVSGSLELALLIERRGQNLVWILNLDDRSRVSLVRLPADMTLTGITVNDATLVTVGTDASGSHVLRDGILDGSRSVADFTIDPISFESFDRGIAILGRSSDGAYEVITVDGAGVTESIATDLPADVVPVDLAVTASGERSGSGIVVLGADSGGAATVIVRSTTGSYRFSVI